MDEFAAIDESQSLFLRSISEPRENSLRVVIQRGSAGPEKEIELPGLKLQGREVRSGLDDPIWEIVWSEYIAYAVLNESYPTKDPEGTLRESGNRFCIYARSSFLAHLSRASIATSDYPGPFRHYCLVCENHIVDVAAAQPPQIRRLEPAFPPHVN